MHLSLKILNESKRKKEKKVIQIRDRCSHLRCSIKKLFLKILKCSQENTYAAVYFFIKLQDSGRRCFPVNILKFLRTPNLKNIYERLLVKSVVCCAHDDLCPYDVLSFGPLSNLVVLINFHCVKSVQIRWFFWFVFSRIRTEYGKILRISPYSVRMRENTNQKNSVFGHISHSVCSYKTCTLIEFSMLK